MKLTPMIATVVAALFACGCASTPVRYLTLDMDSSGAIANGGHVVVEDVALSDALRRPELLVYAGKTEIEYYGDTHWVSSLTELIYEKLESEFGPSREGEQPAHVRVNVWHFGEDETVEPRCARVKLSVSVWEHGASFRDDALWSNTYEESVPIAGSDVSNVAAALSTGLEVIALQIVEDVERRSQ